MSILKKFYLGEWNIGICNRDFVQLLDSAAPGATIKLDVRWMQGGSRGSFYADPFIYSLNNDKALILAEEYIYRRKKGVISILEIGRQSAQLNGSKCILEETCHLSYPYYDPAASKLYPESFRNSQWNQYEIASSNHTSKYISGIPLSLIDCTPFYYKGKWWLFATQKPNALSDLYIYYSDSINGPYTPHKANPVKCDIATSRPAGKMFMHKGAIYRPVQDSTHRYGEAIHIMKVTELDEDKFSEELCVSVQSADNRYPLGFHTINFMEDFIVVDGYREVFRPLYAIYLFKILPKLRRIKRC